MIWEEERASCQVIWCLWTQTVRRRNVGCSFQIWPSGHTHTYTSGTSSFPRLKMKLPNRDNVHKRNEYFKNTHYVSCPKSTRTRMFLFISNIVRLFCLFVNVNEGTTARVYVAWNAIGAQNVFIKVATANDILLAIA